MKKQVVFYFFLMSSFFASSQIYNWAKTINGIDTNCHIYSSDTDPAGNLYVTGVLMDSLDFDPGIPTLNLSGKGKPSIFLAKYNSNGVLVWAQRFGSEYTDNGGGMGHSIKLDTLGNIYIAGLFKGGVDFNSTVAEATLFHSGNFNNVFLAKYTNSGDFTWATNVASMTSPETDLIKNINIRIDHQGYPFITSSFMGTISINPGGPPLNYTATNVYNHWFARYLPWGPSFMWSKVLKSDDDILVKDLQLDTAGNIYVAGNFKGVIDLDPGASAISFSSTNSSQDFFLAKYNRYGAYTWAHTFGGQGTDQVFALGLDGSNNIYITGSIDVTVDMDPGSLTHTVNNAGLSSYIAKFDKDGNYGWANCMEGTSSSSVGRAIKTDNSGNIFVAGYFSNSADFDPGVGTYNLSSQSAADLYFAKYSSGGILVGAAGIGGSGSTADMNQSATNLSLDANGNIYLTGAFKGTVDFDPGTGTANFSSTTNSNYNIFMARYSGTSLVTGLATNNKLIQGLNLYPNPFHEQASLSLKLVESSSIKISIFNVSGALVKIIENKKLDAGTYLYDVKLEENGIYFLKIEADGISETKKIIVLD